MSKTNLIYSELLIPARHGTTQLSESLQSKAYNTLRGNYYTDIGFFPFLLLKILLSFAVMILEIWL